MNEKQGQISVKRVREALKAAGIKQKDLADEIGKSPDYVYKIIRGERNLTKKIAQSISKLTGVRAEYLLGEDDYKTLRDLALRSNKWGIAIGDGIDTYLEYIAESQLNTSMRIEVNELYGPSDTRRKTYYFNNRDDSTTITVNGQRIYKLKNELQHYAEFLLEKLLEEEAFMGALEEVVEAYTDSHNEETKRKGTKDNEST